MLLITLIKLDNTAVKPKTENESQMPQHVSYTFKDTLFNVFCTYRFDHYGSALACCWPL